MADKSISELIAATQVTPSDLFVLEQAGSAKKLSGQTLINDLLKELDGHGGIQSVEKIQTSGLVDTYRITFADSSYTVDFTVNNGKGITGISKTSTSGLVDTYRIYYNDSTSTTFTVTNGAKGDKGDNAYTWFKYASEKPTSSSSSMGDEPDDWMGVYTGNKSSAPTNPLEYTWSLIKGNKGDKGDPAKLVSTKIEYQVSNDGSVVPSGSWSTSVPTVQNGNYLWTRVTVQFNLGDAIVFYSVGYTGLDGTGAVSTVNGQKPDSTGNVTLGPNDVKALPVAGGSMSGPVDMESHRLTGLTTPIQAADAVRKDYVDAKYANATLTTSGWSSSAPYTQTVSVSGVVAQKAPRVTPVFSGVAENDLALKEALGAVSYAKPGSGNITFTCLEEKPTMDIPIQVEVRN